MDKEAKIWLEQCKDFSDGIDDLMNKYGMAAGGKLTCDDLSRILAQAIVDVNSG